MEIQSKIGSKILLKEGSETIEFGRNLGVDSTDLTVSRRHICFQLHKDQTKVSFEVIGKNPIWVRDNRSDEIRVYRRSERGEMESGYSFSVSLKNPVWFNLKRIEYEDEHKNETEKQLRFVEEFAESSGIEDVEIETSSFSHIDPIKEFDFVVMGHEFDCYPKKMIHVKNWDWFLEESGEESDDDEVDKSKRTKGDRRKRKKSGGDDDDDVWIGESEEDTEVIKKMRNVQRPKYSTRSKDGEKNRKGADTSKSTWQKDTTARNTRTGEDEEEEEDEDDEDDDTLGGFIVDEDVEGESGEDVEEEEEFEDDDNDDE